MSHENEANTGLSSLYEALCTHSKIWYHETTSYGCKVVHVLNEDGWEIAWLNNATKRWELRNYSPQRWFPIPEEEEKCIPLEFCGDESSDRFNLSLFTTF
ncbi:hypothetical protein KX16_003633 [Salmonella enterica subsp. enterica]|nr:hypothetical protein [Salmonella enterica subsp. enterica serovar Mikawasima]